MDPTASASFSRHLVFSRDNFADFWAALTARVRRDNYADLVYSGAFAHPMLAYQQTRQATFTQTGIPTLTAAELDMDPLGLQHQFEARAAAIPNSPSLSKDYVHNL